MNVDIKKVKKVQGNLKNVETPKTRKIPNKTKNMRKHRDLTKTN